MARVQKQLEFANFVCRFGDELVMLDMLDDVVLPAFFQDGPVRTYGETKYLFLHTGLKVVGGKLCLVGRYVVNRKLKSDQVLDEKTLELQPNDEEIPHAPSSLFVLMLESHRLLYLKETKGAPGLDSFQTTVQHALKAKHRTFIDDLLRAKYSNADRTPAKEREASYDELLGRFPEPTLDIRHLATEKTLTEFVKQFSILKTVEISFPLTNNDLDLDPAFRKMREMGQKVGSKETIFKHHNDQGLAQRAAVEQVNPLIGEGNNAIVLSGVDVNNNPLRGGTESFKIRIPFRDVYGDVASAASAMYHKFMGYVDNGLIKINSHISDRNRSKLDELKDSLRNGSQRD